MYSITKFGDSISNMGIRQFLADNISDIDKLPHITSKGEQQVNNTSSNAMISAGSNCLCIENSSWYILGNDDIWHKIPNANIEKLDKAPPLNTSKKPNKFSLDLNRSILIYGNWINTPNL